MDRIPNVVQALAGENFIVYAYFDDGAIRMVDMKPLLAKGGVFTPLSDEALFREKLTILNDTVAWDMMGNRDETACIDIDPCWIYEDCTPVSDPLQETA